MDRERKAQIKRILFSVVIPLLVLAGLSVAGFYNFLLFHSLAELFSVIVAVGIFTIAWNSREFALSAYLLILGVAYLFVGFIDIIHTLAYKGMGIFKTNGGNEAAQLWLAARFMESISLFAVAFYTRRQTIRPYMLFSLYLVVTVIFIVSIFGWKIFPDCFVEPNGLTAFKKVSEWVISVALIGATSVMFIRRQDFEPEILKYIIASILTMIGSELILTLYANNLFGPLNIIGHFLKIISFYLIYKAIIEAGLKRPYSILFRDLKRSEEKILHEKQKLEKALSDLKTLKGMLPICASCKKIRDDTGYWNQIETYIKAHSEAEFSRSICPECARKFYPAYVKLDV